MIAPVTSDSDSEDESLLDDDDDVIGPDFEHQLEIIQENYEFIDVQQEDDTVHKKSRKKS